ncbi:MAG: hypothetical protein NZM04_07890 [Methylacidiphilales bacterium]|nr:hypothetical protein [Candidatus Methylacidiphilales bacterium]
MVEVWPDRFTFHALLHIRGIYFDPSFNIITSNIQTYFTGFAHPDDMYPYGNYPGPEDKDWDNDGIIDKPTLQSGFLENYQQNTINIYNYVIHK